MAKEKKKLKIALLAPLTKTVEFDTRGSRPRIVYDLANHLTKRGHDVTTFASADSHVPGKLIPMAPKALYKLPPDENPFYQCLIYMSLLVSEIARRASEFDIIHNHHYPEFLPLLVSDYLKTPIVTTPHLYLWPELVKLHRRFQNSYFVPIAKYQKMVGRGINFLDVIYNGIEVKEFEFNDKPKDYILFFGRMKKFKDPKSGKVLDPKGLADAIKAAKIAKVKLYIAGNVEDPKYYKTDIKPHLGKLIKFIGPVEATGPIGFKQKVELFKNARAYIFPSKWGEGCPVTPMESMACGTPAIAYNKTSLPEIIKNGKTGFIVKEGDIKGLVNAIKNIDSINREDCRKWMEEKFTAERMTREYEETYYKIIAQHKK